jgi:type IV pilus assembly protein PilC
MEVDLKNIRRHTQASSAVKEEHRSFFGFLNTEIKLGRRKISDSKKERFYNQLGILFSSGIDLGSGLQIVLEEKQSPQQKKLFQQVYDDVIAGLSFSEALRKTGQFSDYEYFSIKVGEESGRLQEVLKELTGYFELRVQQRRQLSGALSYPIMVTIVAIGAVIFMLNVVVPMFAGVFQRFGGELPAITRNVLELSNWLSSHLLSIFMLLIIFIASIVYFKRYPWFKKYSGLLVLRLPFAGKLISKLMHARFCHSVSLLSSTQVPLLESLEMVKQMIGFHPWREGIEHIQAVIIRGKHMHEGMEGLKIFDHRLIALTKVGEEVNQIGSIYGKLYRQYTEEVKHMTSVLGNMLEPAMIVVVGLLVMVILIAMYLPLFQLSTTVM